jgi:serine/threonine protein kinase
MEIASADLEKLISRNLTLPEKLDLLLQMILALYSLRIKKINHLDIKPANILVVETDTKFNIKLSDFGESR